MELLEIKEKVSVDFDRKWAKSITSDEFLQRMYQHIDAWEWKK